jgi:toxin ParE1/3/4
VRVRLHPEARNELRVAALWYDARHAGLGDELLSEVGAALERVAESPHSFPLWTSTGATGVPIRRAVIHRFPYVLAFEVYAAEALVLAVAHARRRPLYWLSRSGHRSD